MSGKTLFRFPLNIPQSRTTVETGGYQNVKWLIAFVVSTALVAAAMYSSTFAGLLVEEVRRAGL